MTTKAQKIKLQIKIELLHKLLNAMDGNEVCYNQMVDHKDRLVAQL